jgi:hypothetical protein
MTMKKAILICMLLLPLCYGGAAQTRYYKQLKVVSADRSERKGDGSGQFITFNNKGCYDSDRNGYTVNNGFLNFGKKDGERAYYSGASYWGNATYVFTENYGRLNVRVTSTETTYVYVLSSPPSDALTCALIRKPDSHGVSPVIINPVIINSSANSPPPTTTTSPPVTTKTCSFCKGTGKSPIKTDAPYFGGGIEYVRCSHCGELARPHYHERCPSCMGRGYTGGY